MKKFFNLFLSFLIVLNFAALFPQKVNAINTFSGMWADTLRWEFDSTNGTLTISGIGDMPMYAMPHLPFSINNVKKLIICDGVTSIGELFCAWENLTIVELADSVLLKERTFDNWWYVEQVTLPSHITVIPDFCFYNCKKLTNITLPDSVTSIGENAFGGCENLKSVSLSPNITSIENSTFENCSSLIDIIIPDSVTEIKNYAFSGCASLVEIHIPKNVEFVYSNAFMGCSSLKKIEVSKENTRYTSLDGVLHNASGVTLEIYPAGKENVEYEISEDVYSIGSEAFYGCTNLEKITVSEKNNKLFSIDGVLFNKDGHHDEIYTNGTLIMKTGIELIVYPPAKKDKSYTIPENVKMIAGRAFSKTKNLTHITLPDSMTDVCSYAFYECESLETITIPNTVTNFDNFFGKQFSGCTNLKSISIPDGVNIIPDFCFENCTNLKSVILPNTLTTIGLGAFEGCKSLEEIIIPQSVTEIIRQAFYDCTNLKNVYYSGSKTDWNKIAIGLMNKLLTNANIIFEYTDDFYFDIVNYSREENTVSVKINCSSAVFENGVQVIIALYGDNKLIDYYYADAAASVSHIFENFEDLYGTYEIKAFVWADLTNLIPNKNYISKII